MLVIPNVISEWRLVAVATSLRYYSLVVNTYNLMPRDYWNLERHHQANAFIICFICCLVKFNLGAKLHKIQEPANILQTFFFFFQNKC